MKWLVTIAERKIKDAAVKKRPERLALDLEDSRPELRLEGRESTPGGKAQRRELKEFYDQCVETLPEAQRQVVIWRDYGLFTWEEISREVGSPSVHAAQQLYQRAREKLEEDLRRRFPHGL
jgi:RNA polymerase sigma-70 factor (ECF subfamily)